MTIAIVTDSTCDLPQRLRERYRIAQVPASIIIEGQTFQDGMDISREEYYRNLPTYDPLPTTAAPSSGTFQNIYQNLFADGYTEILSIHIASSLSGIVNAARVAAGDFQERIRVVDSGQVSLGLGFQVIEAAQGAANGLPMGDILKKIKNLQEKIFVFAILDSLEYIQKSGRIPWITANLGAFFHIKPLIELKYGNVTSAGFSRARSRAIDWLREKIQSLGPLRHLGILHSNAKEEGAKLLSRVKDSAIEETLLVNVTTSIGTHVGPRGLGFATVVK